MSIRIPEDLSFVAYDDMEWMTFVEPNITALWQPVYDMGTVAAEMLIRRLRSPEVEPVRRVLGTKLIVRGSTMAPR
jgi:LacI family transcriptional regulator